MIELLRHGDRIEGDLVIEVAFTDISLSMGDAAELDVRAAALAAVHQETGARPVLMHQVHGVSVDVVEERRTSTEPDCDAMITAQPDVALLARAADCVPVLLADPDTGWIGAVHAGRAGVMHGVVPAVMAALRQRGARPTVAWIGPHVCGSCYEVPLELQADVVAQVPAARSTTSWGTPAVDLGAGVRAQLSSEGVDDVRTVDACTREDPSWPSHRRDGQSATRFAGVIWSHR